MEESQAKNIWLRKLGEYLLVIGIILLVATISIIFQLKNHNHIGIISDDTMFHSNRIYDTAQQLLHNNFSYFQMNYGWYQSGRIINAVYGSIFAYFLGGAILIAGTWFRFQVLTNYLLFILGGVGMYRLARKAKAASWTSLIGMTLFLVIGYIAYWPLGNTFNSWGAALMPYVLIQGLNMIQKKQGQINWMMLGIVMAVVAQVHLLSVGFSALALIPFFIYGLVISKDRARLIRNLGQAILLFIVLTANVWGAFLLLYHNNHLASTEPFLLYETALQVGNITVSQFISKITLLVVFFQFLYAIWNHKNHPVNVFVTLEGIGFLFLSSQLFIWTFLEHHVPMLMIYLQFPNRFTVIAYPLLCTGIAISLSQIKWTSTAGKIIGASGIVVIGIAILFNLRANTLLNHQKVNSTLERTQNKVVQWTNDKDLSKFVSNVIMHNPDYLPLHQNIDVQKVKDIFTKNTFELQGSIYKKEVLSNGKLKVSWQAKKDQKMSLLPIVMYSQSKLIVNGKDKGQIKHYNAVGMPYVRNQIGNNSAILSFQTPVWFTILLIISILSWIGIISFTIFKKTKEHKLAS